MFCSFYFYLLLWGQYNSAAWGPRDKGLLVTGIRRTCNFDLLNRPPQFFGQFLSNYRKPKIVEKNWNKNRINLEPKKSVFYKYFKSGRKKLSNPVIQLCFARSPLWPFQNFDWQSVVGWVIFYLPPLPTSASSHHMHAHTLLFYHLFLSPLSDLLAVLWLFHSLNKLSLSLSLSSLSLSLSLSLFHFLLLLLLSFSPYHKLSLSLNVCFSLSIRVSLSLSLSLTISISLFLNLSAPPVSFSVRVTLCSIALLFFPFSFFPSASLSRVGKYLALDDFLVFYLFLPLISFSQSDNFHIFSFYLFLEPALSQFFSLCLHWSEIFPFTYSWFLGVAIAHSKVEYWFILGLHYKKLERYR